MNNANIKEIFTSIQGEGIYIGEQQLFIRFCGCNLQCAYCDTDFSNEVDFPVHDLKKFEHNPVTPENLLDIIKEFDTQTISFTGGEPLLYSDFLAELLPELRNKKIYLETNGTLPDELSKIIQYTNVIAMDIKLPSATNQAFLKNENRKFLEIATKNNKEIFVKIIIGKNYKKDEILETIEIIKPFKIPLIIQPMDTPNTDNTLDFETITEIMNLVNKNYNNCRFIPQMHKYLKLM